MKTYEVIRPRGVTLKNGVAPKGQLITEQDIGNARAAFSLLGMGWIAEVKERAESEAQDQSPPLSDRKPGRPPGKQHASTKQQKGG